MRAMNLMRPWPVLLGLALLAACSTETPIELQRGDFTARLVDGGQTLALSHGDRELLRLQQVTVLRFAPKVKMLFGFFDHEMRDAESVPLAFSGLADQAEEANEAIALHGADGVIARLELTLTDNDQLALRLLLDEDAAAQGVQLAFECAANDRFWGFGEQYNFVDLRGQQVPVWVQEQGVGRQKDPTLPHIGALTDSYFPMPYFVDPEAGKGLLVTNSEYSLFDLCKGDPERWTVDIWNGREAGLKILSGPEPRDVVSQLTAEPEVGRPKSAPPDWAFSGTWIAAQGGREKIEQRLHAAIDAGISVATVWAQDWVGARELVTGRFGVKYRWAVDETLYPDLGQLIADLRKRDVRFIGYFNPFVLPDFEHYLVGDEKGYLIQGQDGESYDFFIISFKGSMLDVTNPEAVSWFKGFAKQAVDLGMAGWMADFGEWLPFDAQLHSGDAPAFHNRYATAWHRINREVLEQAYPDGDFLLLTRSGYTGEHEVAQVVWAGDQETDWGEDGLPTVINAALTIGLSGVPYFTHDIAGFSGEKPRGKELYQRWAELGAFSPIMRTHDGLHRDKNHHFDSDAETLAHFAKMAKIHEALSPYLIELAAEARSTGLPMIRHTVLVDPDWAEALTAHGQWLLGDDLLFAPVLAAGKQQVDVWLPEGTWQHLLSGKRYDGRQRHAVDAPIGEPAAFVRDGKLAQIVAAIR